MSGEGGLLARVAAARAALDDLAGVEVAGLDPVEATVLYRELTTVSGQLAAFAARVLAHVEADGRWSAGSARTFPEWMAGQSMASVSSVRRQTELGHALDGDLPMTAAAVAAGEITVEHAQVLARFGPTSVARRAVLAGDQADRNEAHLVEQAKHTRADDFGKLVRRWATTQDQAAADGEHQVAAAKEFLTLGPQPDGMHLRGFLTHEHGTALMTALRAVTGVPAADDLRGPQERQAAALTGLARMALDGGRAGAGKQVRPHISVHVSWETMQRLATEHPGARHDGSTDDDGQPACAELDGGEPIPTSLLGRIACDSEISRIVFGTAGEVLDVGKTRRTYTGYLRRAIVARDRHCQYPTCTAPPELGEVHHRVGWARGGDTSLANGILLCWHHHDYIHRHGITIARSHDRWVFGRRDGTTIRAGSPGATRPAPPGGATDAQPRGAPAPPGGEPPDRTAGPRSRPSAQAPLPPLLLDLEAS